MVLESFMPWRKGVIKSDRMGGGEYQKVGCMGSPAV
jgi:hypothetical protein